MCSLMWWRRLRRRVLASVAGDRGLFGLLEVFFFLFGICFLLVPFGGGNGIFRAMEGL